MSKSKKELPATKFIEVPDDLVCNLMFGILAKEVKDYYNIDYFRKIDSDRWIIKVVKRDDLES